MCRARRYLLQPATGAALPARAPLMTPWCCACCACVTPRRKLPSFLRNLLRDDLGQLRLDVDLEVHAMTSGIPVTNATVQEVCELDPMVQRLTLRNCYAVSDAGLWYVCPLRCCLPRRGRRHSLSRTRAPPRLRQGCGTCVHIHHLAELVRSE